MVSCGSTMTATVTANGKAYIWGSGLPQGQIRLPQLIPLKSNISISINLEILLFFFFLPISISKVFKYFNRITGLFAFLLTILHFTTQLINLGIFENGIGYVNQ